MMRKEQMLNEGWQLHTAGQPDWQPARVPGTVYTTLYENGRIPDPYWRDNAETLLPLMEQDYEYRLEFDLPVGYETAPRLLLRFEGVDTLGEITLNGQLLGRTDNMHRTWEFEITGSALPRGNQLLVKLASPLKYIRDAFANRRCGARRTPWTASSICARPTVCSAGTGAHICRTPVCSGRWSWWLPVHSA